jgi:hypothetical protein
MIKNITKVKTQVKRKIKAVGWSAVLDDLRAEIGRLETLVPVVEGKIKRGEPWPGTQSSDQNSEQQHSA